MTEQPENLSPRADAPSPHDRPEIWAPRLLRIIEEQIERFEELDGMSRRQSELIESEDTDALLTLLAQRQTVVDRITELNGDLTPFLERWGELSSQAPDAERERISAAVNRLDGLVAEITRRDDADRAVLERRRAGVQSEMTALNRGRSAVNAYASQKPSGNPRYQDREG